MLSQCHGGSHTFTIRFSFFALKSYTITFYLLLPIFQSWHALTIYYITAGSEPRFLSTMVNASVTVGRDAALTCHISHSEGYKVTTQ